MKKIIILIPIYNDWKSIFKLLEKIDSEIIKHDAEYSVVIVNDASTDDKPQQSLYLKYIKSIE